MLVGVYHRRSSLKEDEQPMFRIGEYQLGISRVYNELHIDT